MSLNRNPVSLTKNEQAALDIISSHRALVKVVADKNDDDDAIDYSRLDFNLNQIADPTANRPSRSAYYFSLTGKSLPSVVTKTDLKTNKTHDHNPGQCRYTHNKGVDFTHTAKTSTSLIPPQPQYMSLFGDDVIGFGWDINACNLKNEKYVWATDAGSDCNWYTPCPYDDRGTDWLPPLSSVTEIRSNNNKAIENKETIRWNEILAGLPKGRCDFMFAPLDTLDLRLRMWDAMIHTKGKLKLEDNIALLIIHADHMDGQGQAFRVYTAEEREKDLQAKAIHSSQNDGHTLAKLGLFSSKQISCKTIFPASELQTSLSKGLVGF